MLAKLALLFICGRVAFAFSPAGTHIKSHLSVTSPLKMSFQLDPSETSFVFIEFQNEFCSEGGKLHDAVKDCMAKTNMLENASKVAKAAREAGCTIIHCPINFEPGHNEISNAPYGVLAGIKDGKAFTNGEWGADFCEAMRPVPGDLIVKGKSGLCGFQSTNLEFLLSQKNTKNVVLSGL